MPSARAKLRLEEPPRSPATFPYRVITTDNPDETFGEGKMTYFATMLAAANAFVKADAPFKVVVYDDGCVARELNAREERLLEAVCSKLGYELGEVEG